MSDTYIGDWHHIDDGDGPRWSVHAPEFTAMDFGIVAESGVAASPKNPTRPGLLACVPAGSKPPEGLELLSTDDPREFKPDGRALDQWESLFKYRPQGETLAQWMLDHLMNGSDPRGEAACKPLLPGRTLSLHMGETLFSRPFDFASDPYRAKVLDVLRLDSKALWEQENSSDAKKPVAGTTQKYLDKLCEQYGIAKTDYKILLPTDIRNDVPAPIKHGTNFTENFDGADKSGVGYQLTWTDTSGVGGVNRDNKFKNGSTAAGVIWRAEHDVSSQNHYVEATGSIDGTGTVKTLELHCRWSASAETYYYMFYRGNPGTENFRAGRTITNSSTETVSTGGAVASPMRLRISIGEDGTAGTFRARVNGSQLYNVTDTNITGHTRGGARLRHNATLYGAELDDWIINDVFVPVRASIMSGGSRNYFGILSGGRM